jgi:magnesium transporter
MIIDCAYYCDGARHTDGAMAIGDAVAHARDAGAGFVWMGMYEPTEDEMLTVQQAFNLHELACEDAQCAHQRPKIEDYEDDVRFIVFRTARYDEAREEAEFGEIHIFAGPGYIITVRHGAASELHGARLALEARPELLALGPMAVVWAILDKVVDDYHPVAERLDDDIEGVEDAVFRARDDITERIYILKREVIEFQRAVHPLLAPLATIERGGLPGVGPDLRRFFRDVEDNVRRLDEQVRAQRDVLAAVLQANMAVIGIRQNEVMRKISGWAGIIAVPTFIASIYGMNFVDIPELKWAAGYPVALSVMFLSSIALYIFLKRVDWL